jgi:hypothetical protein
MVLISRKLGLGGMVTRQSLNRADSAAIIHVHAWSTHRCQECPVCGKLPCVCEPEPNGVCDERPCTRKKKARAKIKPADGKERTIEHMKATTFSSLRVNPCQPDVYREAVRAVAGALREWGRTLYPVEQNRIPAGNPSQVLKKKDMAGNNSAR